MAAKKTSRSKASKSSGSKSRRSKGELDTEDRNELSSGSYAFPDKRKEPLNDASHVRNAIARFDQVKGVSDEERREAFSNIKKAARKFGVDMKEKSWRELGKHPHTRNPSQSRAKKG